MSIGTASPGELSAPDSFFPLSLQLPPAVAMTQDQFFDFCQINPDFRFERTAQGELIVMPPSGGDSGFRDASVVGLLYAWWTSHKKGKASGPSGGYILPNGANRSPDASWISPEQLAVITADQRQKFLPVCPFFLVEVRSITDSLKKLQEKMEEYIANGCRLGWLIDPIKMQVHIYRPGQDVQVVDGRTNLSAEPELPGFVLDLGPVWRP